MRYLVNKKAKHGMTGILVYYGRDKRAFIEADCIETAGPSYACIGAVERYIAYSKIPDAFKCRKIELYEDGRIAATDITKLHVDESMNAVMADSPALKLMNNSFYG